MITPSGEAAAIWAALFGGVVPERVCRRYTDALAQLPLQPDPIDGSDLWQRPRRLAAVEFYLRLSRRNNGLSQRFHVLFYLAELEPQLFSRFAGDRSSKLRACVDLGLAGLAAPLLFAFGLWCWRRAPRA